MHSVKLCPQAVREDSTVEDWHLDVIDFAKLRVTYFGRRNDQVDSILSCTPARPGIHQ